MQPLLRWLKSLPLTQRRALIVGLFVAFILLCALLALLVHPWAAAAPVVAVGVGANTLRQQGASRAKAERESQKAQESAKKAQGAAAGGAAAVVEERGRAAKLSDDALRDDANRLL